MSDLELKTPGAEVRPEVSVIIPAYNSAAYIGEALDSVLAQTFDRYEVIVINDGSPDTEELERELQRYSSKVRYIKQENRGAAAARNVGLLAARGELVAFLDADDSYLPVFLEKQIALLRSNNADLVHSDALLLGDARLAGQTFMNLQRAAGDVTAVRLLSIKAAILTSTVLARKAPISEVGGFDVALRRGQDFDLWFRMAKAGFRFAYQPEILVNHRKLESGLSGGPISSLHRTVNILSFIEARGGLTSAESEALQVTMKTALRGLAVETGKEKLLNRDFAGARRAFDDARNQRASWKLLLVSLGLRIAPEMLWRIYQRRELAWRRQNAMQLKKEPSQQPRVGSQSVTS